MAGPSTAELQVNRCRGAAPRCAAWTVAAAMASCAVAALAGCRNLDNAQVDVLERELRQQENYIYELEDYLVEYSEKLREARLAQCPPGSAAKKSPPGKRPLPEPTLDEDPIERPTLPLNGREKLPSSLPPAAPPPSEASTTPEGGPAETAAPTPERTEPEPAEPAQPLKPEEMQIPELEIGPGVGAAPRAAGDSLAADAAADEITSEHALVIPDPVDFQTDANSPGDIAHPAAIADPPAAPLLAAPENGPSRMDPERLQIRRVFAESPSADAASPESLLVIVEALNATDEPVDAAGEASLMIMLRDAPGSLHRVDRWDFSADETKTAWQSSHLGDGLHLELPLHERPLPAGELELWARLVGPGGKKLLTQIPLDPAKLASVDDAAEDAKLTASAMPATDDATPLAETAIPNADATPLEATPPEKLPQTWRASAQANLQAAVPADAKASAGWIRRAGAGEPHTAAVAKKASAPSWQRSKSLPQSATTSAWAPDR
jgi:hypothetical protein